MRQFDSAIIITIIIVETDAPNKYGHIWFQIEMNTNRHEAKGHHCSGIFLNIYVYSSYQNSEICMVHTNNQFLSPLKFKTNVLFFSM